MICALICAWFALDLRLVCATGVGVPVAQRKSFSSDQESKIYKVLQPFLRKRSPTIGRGTPPALLHSRRTMLPFHLLTAMACDRVAKCLYIITVLRCAVPRRRPQMVKWTMAR